MDEIFDSVIGKGFRGKKSRLRGGGPWPAQKILESRPKAPHIPRAGCDQTLPVLSFDHPVASMHGADEANPGYSVIRRARTPENMLESTRLTTERVAFSIEPGREGMQS